MINVLHLLWIIPMSSVAGMLFTALIVGGTR